MGGITSNAIYFASSLTAAGNPAVASADARVVPVVVTLSSPPAAEQGTPIDRGYVIVDVPGFDRSANSRNLGELIAAEVKQSTERYAALGNNSIYSPPWAGDPGQADLSTNDETDINQAVVASHEARILLLKKRIDSLRAGDNAVLRDLAIRLKRAEAARNLAVARAALTNQPRQECDMAPELAGCRAGVASVTVENARRDTSSILIKTAGMRRAGRELAHKRIAPSALPKRVAQASKAPARHARSPDGKPRPAGVALASATARRIDIARGPASKRLHALTAHPNPAPRVTIAVTATVKPSTGIERASSDNLERARRLLAMARNKLEGTAGNASPIKSAGLWQWEGSDKWSLADYPKRTT